MGILEHDFWNMTLAELERQINSNKRKQRERLQEKASFDYALADLIGRSISRIYSSANTIPDISEVYPTIFDSKEIQAIKEKKKQELSALRFIQFADSHNRKFKEVANKDE